MKILSEEKTVLTPDTMSNRCFRERKDTPRTPGLHVQAINRYLAVGAGELQPEDNATFERFSDTCYPLLPALGVAWEEFRASTYSESELLWQGEFGELSRDDIYGTPDGLLIGDVYASIWECKLTYKKMKRVVEDWLYMRQGMAYCAMSGLSRVMYDVCWALGAYTRPYIPVGTRTLVEFSEQEIETWWSRMLAVRDRVAMEG